MLSGRLVLSEVTLTIEPGQVVVVVGPNGAGKSTLLKALTGILPPSHGAVDLDGQPLSAWPRRELAERRAVLAQSGHVAFPFTVSKWWRSGASPVRSGTRPPCATWP